MTKIFKLTMAALFAGVLISPAMAEDLAAFDGFGSVVEDGVLDVTRGMKKDVEEDFDGMFLAISEGNEAEGGGTRTNEIAGTAFSGGSGVATVIQNSGDNAIIQVGTIVNVSYSD